MEQTAAKPIAVILKPRRLLCWDTWEPVAKFMIVLIGLMIVYLAIERNILFQWHYSQIGRVKNVFIRYMMVMSGLIFIGSLVFRTFLWFKYRAYDSALVKSWPKATVIIPAYNEGETVFETICSIASCDYPEDHLRIIAIDDGSKDDTYSHMERARDAFPHLVELIRFNKNQGKRQALYEGFKKSRSPFVISIDSDTRLDAAAVKELLTPLILNPKLAGVTGRLRVWNRSANMMTRMMNASFAMAFDFTRAVQSTYSNVFCTSGAFSAYRRSVVNRFMDKWLNQTFMKKKCTYGEDRSMTNHILRLGYGTVFQRTAIAHTMLPVQATRILKMLTRWARSNIRESIVFGTFMFNSRRKGNYILPFIEYFATIALIILHFVWFYYFLFSGYVTGTFLFRVLAYTILFGFLSMLYYIRIEGSYDVPYILIYSIFNSIFMIWIFSIAAFTLTRRSWSTR